MHQRILGWSRTDKPRPSSASRAAAHSRIAEGHGVRLAEVLKRLTCRSAQDRTSPAEDCPPNPGILLDFLGAGENGARTKALSIFPDRCAADLVHPPATGGLPVSCVPWAALGRGLDGSHCPAISGILNRSQPMPGRAPVQPTSQLDPARKCKLGFYLSRMHCGSNCYCAGGKKNVFV